MAENKIYKNDVGTVLEAEAQNPDGSDTIDLSAATTLELRITKPDATAKQWTALPKSEDESVAQYTVVAGDLDQDGVYSGQLYAEWDAGNKFHGTTFKFTVYELGQ